MLVGHLLLLHIQIEIQITVTTVGTIQKMLKDLLIGPLSDKKKLVIAINKKTRKTIGIPSFLYAHRQKSHIVSQRKQLIIYSSA
ncbi:hypothetical protein [Psychrobacillus sp. FJAT-21963]|uniref:hypothetical protein n=1 Tax=Psychrobacillus sp. FJAT-21963 TaxID=1712028 RepID=UPI0006FE4E99|nr:hypothetical protein [Psychrobacillus sp. FJAT-21963]KQL34403.1 hypothetical protein AN959_15510 [Psychrobacillus sp. FJAT-21963]